MSVKWEKYAIGEIGEVFDGPHATPKKAESGPIFLGISNLVGGRIDLSSTEYLSEQDYKIWTRRVTPKEHDIVFSYETRLGEVAIIPKSFKCCLGRRMGLIRLNQKIVDPKFLLYYYLSPSFQDVIKEKTVYGSTVERISIKEFPSFPVFLPPLSDQRRIAAILTALDDKIELNRRMNETLEGIARAVWEEWFGKMIEESTNLVRLDTFIKIKHGYAFKGEGISDSENENILLTPGNFNIGGGFSEKKLRFFEGEFPHEYILNLGDLIVTMTDLSKDGDTLGYPAFVPNIFGKKMLHNQRIGLVEFKDKVFGKHFLCELMKTESYRSFILGGATGSTVRHTSPGRICDFAFNMPNEKKIGEFESFSATLHNKVEFNNQQSRTLTALRDALLPRLMRGEVNLQ